MATKATASKANDEKQNIEQHETAKAPVERKAVAPKAFDPDQIITVRNGFQGRLVYRSRKTGERFVWDEFGADQDMEFSELKSARSSGKKYFINNWFMFDDSSVIDALGMTQYYKHSIPVEDFDSLFEKSPSEIERIVNKLSDGQKKSVSYRARQMVADGEIDSNKTIATLEKCLGIELVDR